MPVGAIIGAAGAIGGSLLGASATKKAAKTAATTAQNTANQNNALSRDIYGQNSALLSPYVQRGNAAGNALNSMLGLGGPANEAIPQALGFQQGGFAGSMGSEGRQLPGAMGQMIQEGGYSFDPTMSAQQPQMTAGPAQPSSNPFQSYVANSDYAFNMGNGSNALNHGYAAQGSLQSGAAMKALEKYRQNLQAGYRNEYMGYLGNQQGIGLSGASAVAGVGQNYVNNATANNNSAGSAAANAALYGGVANSNMYAGIGNALGQLGSSYDKRKI